VARTVCYSQFNLTSDRLLIKRLNVVSGFKKCGRARTTPVFVEEILKPS